MTVIEFLLARWDEEEKLAPDAARAKRTGSWRAVDTYIGEEAQVQRPDGEVICYDEGYMGPEVARHIAAHDPDHVLADLDAKRALVRAYSHALTVGPPVHAVLYGEVLAMLSAPYVRHPDYRSIG